ncbi:GNAT family N-acetyltransferase [Microbulbifer thermotolerans]|uniref:GNAT family N-acetyltransferase n=1 Tax=Microbulbifer thermotolerans TaxID=252514 RepID=A0AB35HSW4_MICTH|nr:GNAT family N-acetyltransferase [Microbulbifer thermotolerans]MCX2779386.1 GNAT family N-acetyltransferase [Microbulbifer thermotolerans]MCX2800563.1 GNAT family N-acetyltransferase [Microbulbifer thermotolerans]MCX2805712.1 GNAT family N-acetyltransferase [Microbulbifer thermotolerans]MCX2831187.1 GNAT family N-acetyltransferase [Microbulbifer thermotolerans]WKT62169.1 GNAT family N-acetyltransferase [Microbulbifer thermotolerans]
MADTEIRLAAWEADLALIRQVREAVFIHEQNVDPDIEWDQEEETAQHFLIVQGKEPLATARITTSGKIGRMAVVKKARGCGLGLQLLTFICNYAREHGFSSVYLHAQSHAEGFYRKAGFRSEGEPFIEADIPHIKMVRPLD